MDKVALEELCQLISRYGTADISPLANLPIVRLLKSEGPTEPFAHVCEPVFALVAQGTKRITLNDRHHDCGAGNYLIVPVALPMDSSVVEASARVPFLSFALRLRSEAIAAVLLEAHSMGPISGAPGVSVSQAAADILDPVVRFLRLLDNPDDIPILAPAIEREILWRLVNGEQGAAVRQVGVGDSRTNQISRAIRWIRLHFSEPISVLDLAGIAGMSGTSFHRHFRAVTSMTPIQYQKQIRLQVARSRLMAADDDVARVGFSVGYDSPSQFSREYHRQFGAPPGYDGKRLRSARLTPD